MRIAPDDSVYQVDGVWLGPDSGGTAITLPWTARYKAYTTWLALFAIILLVEAATPLRMGVPPVWEIGIATVATYGMLGFISHERPFVAVWETFVADLRAPRAPNPRTIVLRERFSISRYDAAGRLYFWRTR